MNKDAVHSVSRYLNEYAKTKGIYMKINYVNADHVHALVDLPTGLSVEELMQLLKGSSSHWINENNLAPGKFAWGEDTLLSLCPNQMSIKSRLTLPGKRSIITCAASQRNSRNLSSGMDWLWRIRKAVETALVYKRVGFHRPEGRC